MYGHAGRLTTLFGGFRPGQRAELAAGCLQTGQVVIAGGVAGEAGVDDVGRSLASAHMYDSGTDRWTALPDMRRARSGAAGCALPSGRFVVFGGTDNHAEEMRSGLD